MPSRPAASTTTARATAGLASAVLFVLGSAAAHAGAVTETENDNQATNNTLLTSQNVNSGFAVGGPSTAPGFTGSVPGLTGEWATVSISGALGPNFFEDGTISGDVDIYRFTLTHSGSVFLDIDSAGASDTMLWLFDASGLLLYYDDQSEFGAGVNDPGSTNDNDPFIGDVALGPGNYFAAVSSYSNPALILARKYDGYFGYRASTAAPAIYGEAYGPGIYGSGPINGNGTYYGDFNRPTGFSPGVFNVINGYAEYRFLSDPAFSYPQYFVAGSPVPFPGNTQSPGASINDGYTLHIAVNPEPGTIALFGLGALGLLGLVRRRRRAATTTA